MNRTLKQKHLLTSIFLLVFLFVSSLGHAHTVDILNTSVEQQDCKLCQHHLDKTPQKIKLAPIDVGEFNEPLALLSHARHIKLYFLSPQLRAPPFYF
ncbi:hypothetical protein [Thalassotalea profundi]|uniref:hypothetical protein n=1 Tax=Thalassotalea profundi TaxID=2036687 RepID=UPI0016738DAC|nr:hypothetical protein [Thalassotalea profundi]